MVLKFVTPYRLSGKRGKNDAANAAAICEAVRRPSSVSCRPRACSWPPAWALEGGRGDRREDRPRMLGAAAARRMLQESSLSGRRCFD